MSSAFMPPPKDILLVDASSGPMNELAPRIRVLGHRILPAKTPQQARSLLQIGGERIGAVVLPPGLPALDLRASLHALRGGSFRAILPAHGGILERPARAIDEALLFYEVRIQRTLRTLRMLSRDESPVSAWDLWQQLFPKADPVTQMRTRMLMVIGALDVLEAKGEIVTERDDGGVFLHRAG